MDREKDIVKQTKGSTEDGDIIPMCRAVYAGETKSYERLQELRTFTR